MKLFYDINKVKRFNRDEEIINEQGEKVLAYDNNTVMELLEQSFKIFEHLNCEISTNFALPKSSYTQHEHINFDFKHGVIELLTNPRFYNGLYFGFGTLDHKPVLSKTYAYDEIYLTRLQNLANGLNDMSIPYTVNKDCTVNVKYSFSTEEGDIVYSLNVKLFPKA